MAPFKAGDLVYIPSAECKDLAFLPGTVQETPAGSPDVAIKLEANAGQYGGDTRIVAVADLRRRFSRDDGSTSQDNTSLVHLNDATILENLQARHKADEIYTYTASVLLAMNPYRDIQGLYGDNQCNKYRGKHIGALPPHPYAIADTAYRALVRDQKNQGFIISGESGAGKTETAKIVMQYLGFVSGATSDLAARIQDRVVQAQPILESFGNAVTMRNNNSSRFGKYNRVFFNDKGTLVDAGVTTYLLESSRVVVHSGKERTYHCFYEMLSGLSDEKLANLHLARGRRYRLLASDPETGVSEQEEEKWMVQFQERDVKNFERLCEAFKIVGLSDDDIDSCFQVLAGLVHLGDLAGAEKEESDGFDEGSTVELDEESLAKAAELLGMDPDSLGAALKRKKVMVPGRSSFHESPRTASQFRHALHSLIKALYKRLFERTVQRINSSFKELAGTAAEGKEEEWNHIGILDIYGFERLQRNSFEQLCINLANERLQQYFVENVLLAEQGLYEREGLPWAELTLPDATPVVSAISGVFGVLDDLSQQLAKGMEKQATDEKFCTRTVDEAHKDPLRKDVLIKLKMSNKRGSSVGLGVNEGFVVKHYAGPVEYNTKGWLDKNNDRLLQECEDLICSSSSSFVSSLRDPEKNLKVNFRSISKKYSADLEKLLQTLGTCHLHYIRCFKPNEFQKPNLFNQNLVLDQIIQCGTIELVKIMHDGYPNRCPFEEIVTRFRDMLPESFQRYGMRTFIEALMLAYDVSKEDWALGMSRLFLKAGQLKALEDMRTEGAAPDPEKLKKIVSGIIRKKWVRAKNAVQLVNFLPKFMAEIKATRAARALSKQALAIAKLQPILLAARQRVQERKLAARRRVKAAFFTARLARALMQEAKLKRKQRIETFLYVTSKLHLRLKPWVAGARERAAESEKRREAERRREEERRAAREAEAQKQIEEDRQRMEADIAAQRAALEEEQRKRAEEEEERKRQVAADNAAQLEAKERWIAEEKQRLEDERKAFEEEKEKDRRNSILAAASPQHLARTKRSEETLEDYEERAQASTAAGEEDDLDVGDSASAMNPEMDTRLQHLMDERIKALEQEMAKKQEEVLEQMRALQEKNSMLEKQMVEERSAQAISSPSPDRHASPLSVDADHLHTTPPSGNAGRKSLAQGSATRSAKRYSLLSMGESGCRKSVKGTGGKARRQSAAHEALVGAGHLDGPTVVGDAATRGQEPPAIHSQRKWWAEQRQFLLEDLFPAGSPQRSTPGTGNRSARRTSVGGQADASIAAEQQRRERRATQPTMETIRSNGEPEDEQEAPTKANLANRFDTEAGEEDQQMDFQPPARVPRDSLQKECRLRKPNVYWNKDKRNSVSQSSEQA